MTSGSPDVTARDAVLATIRTRRVVRELGPEPVPEKSLIAVLDAARWAPSAGNRRPHRFVAVRDPAIVRALRAVSPGMLQRPTAVVAICVDLEVVDAYGLAAHQSHPDADRSARRARARARRRSPCPRSARPGFVSCSTCRPGSSRGCSSASVGALPVAGRRSALVRPAAGGTSRPSSGSPPLTPELCRRRQPRSEPLAGVCLGARRVWLGPLPKPWPYQLGHSQCSFVGHLTAGVTFRLRWKMLSGSY